MLEKMVKFVAGIWILVILLISPVTMGQVTTKNAIYNGCGVTKHCFGRPEAGNGCAKNGNGTCEEMVTYAFNKAEKNVKFELYSKVELTTKYVAVGFSKDNSMGDDSVVICQIGTSGVLLKLGVNPSPNPKHTATKESPPDEKILKEISKSADAVSGLKCVFSLPLNFTTQGLHTELNKQVHVFVVGGPTSLDVIQVHSISKARSGLIVITDDPAAKKSNCNKTTAELLHVIGIMCLTSIFVSPVLGTLRFAELK